MINNRDIIVRLREQIPSFECVKGCHDCCGPVTASSEEMSRLPVKSDAEHDAVYEDRPLICRLFGTTPSMARPNDRRPEEMVAPIVEEQVHFFIANTRQVLV